MFERIKQVIHSGGRVHGDGDTSATSRSELGDEAGASRDEQPSSGLFRCDSCEAVYIAQNKETCSTCGTAVSQIRATPSGQSADTAGQYHVEEW